MSAATSLLTSPWKTFEWCVTTCLRSQGWTFHLNRLHLLQLTTCIWSNSPCQKNRTFCTTWMPTDQNQQERQLRYHRDVTFERYKREIPLTARPVHFGEHLLIVMFLQNVLKPASTLLNNSFGIDTSAYPAFYDNMPKGVKSVDRQTWISLCRNVEGFYIHPVGFEMLINHQSLNFFGVGCD